MLSDVTEHLPLDHRSAVRLRQTCTEFVECEALRRRLPHLVGAVRRGVCELRFPDVRRYWSGGVVFGVVTHTRGRVAATTCYMPVGRTRCAVPHACDRVDVAPLGFATRFNSPFVLTIVSHDGSSAPPSAVCDRGRQRAVPPKDHAGATSPP